MAILTERYDDFVETTDTEDGDQSAIGEYNHPKDGSGAPQQNGNARPTTPRNKSQVIRDLLDYTHRKYPKNDSQAFIQEQHLDLHIDRLLKDIEQEKKTEISTIGRARTYGSDLLEQVAIWGASGAIAGYLSSKGCAGAAAGALIGIAGVISSGLIERVIENKGAAAYEQLKSDGAPKSEFEKFFKYFAFELYLKSTDARFAAQNEILEKIRSYPEHSAGENNNYDVSSVGDVIGACVTAPGYLLCYSLLYSAGATSIPVQTAVVMGSMAVPATILYARESLVKKARQSYKRYLPLLGDLEPDQRQTLVNHLIDRWYPEEKPNLGKIEILKNV